MLRQKPLETEQLWSLDYSAEASEMWEKIFLDDDSFEVKMVPEWETVVSRENTIDFSEITLANDTVIRAMLKPQTRKKPWNPDDPKTMEWSLVFDIPPTNGEARSFHTTVWGDHGFLNKYVANCESYVAGSMLNLMGYWADDVRGPYCQSDKAITASIRNDLYIPTESRREPFNIDTVEKLYRGLKQRRTGEFPAWMTNCEVRAELTDEDSTLGLLQSQLIILGVHMMVIEYEKILQERLIMAKNNNDYDYWKWEGSKTKISKLRGYLSNNSHHLIEDTQKTFYLGIQHSEIDFVKTIGSDHGLKPKLQEEAPEFTEARCGKNVTRHAIHVNQCSACGRIISNERKAEDAERRRLEAQNKEPEVRASTDPRSGEVMSYFDQSIASKHIFVSNADITYQDLAVPEPDLTVGWPNEDLNPHIENIQHAVLEYEAMAEQYLVKASECQTLASKYRALIDPSDALRQAQEALRVEQEREVERRREALEDLQVHLSTGG